MDWIEEAHDVLTAWVTDGNWVHPRHISLLKRGIEEVRALRKDNEELEASIQFADERRQGWQDLAKYYDEKHGSACRWWANRGDELTRTITAQKATIEQLEKEKRHAEELAEAHAESVYAIAADERKWQEKCLVLEKEKAELAELVDRYERQKFECFPIGPFKETPTLRDEFAMAALQGILSYVEVRNYARSGKGYFNGVAGDAYLQADAMLEARDENRNKENQ